MARNQKSVRYDDGRNNDFRLHFTFGREDSTSPEYFHWILKCYESKARGSPERDGLRRLKRPELRGVIEKILPLTPLPADFENRSRQGRMSALARLASDQAKEATLIYERNQVCWIELQISCRGCELLFDCHLCHLSFFLSTLEFSKWL